MAIQRALLMLYLLLATCCLAETIADVDNLVLQFSHGAAFRGEIFSNAIAAINSYVSSPSCTRLAVQSLIGSCEVVANDAQQETTITGIKETAAVRLALCELSAAQCPTPVACKAFLSTTCDEGRPAFMTWILGRTDQTTSVKAENVCFPQVAMPEVSKCMKALRNEPQSWTSYSNAYQNVGSICQATRSAIEKDEILNLHRSMANVHQGLNVEYQNILQNGHRFALAVARLQDQGLERLDRGVDELDSRIAATIRSLEEALNTVGGKIGDNDAKISKRIDLWAQGIKSNMDSSADIALRFGEIDQQAISLASWFADVLSDTHAVDHSLSGLISKASTAASHIDVVSKFHESLTGQFDNLTEQITIQSERLQLLGREKNGFLTSRNLLVVPAVVTLTGMFPQLAQWLAILSGGSYLCLYMVNSALPDFPYTTIWSTFPLPGLANLTHLSI